MRRGRKVIRNKHLRLVPLHSNHRESLVSNFLIVSDDNVDSFAVVNESHFSRRRRTRATLKFSIAVVGSASACLHQYPQAQESDLHWSGRVGGWRNLRGRNV